MNNKTLRLILLLAIFSLGGIAVTQTYWIRMAMQAQDNEFDAKVNVALHSVASSILKYNKNTSFLVKPVLKIGSNDYVVKVNDVIRADLLEALLKKELDYAGIKDAFDFRIYDCYGKKMIFEKRSKLSERHPYRVHTSFSYDNYFFGLSFPGRKNSYSRIVRWLLSTIILLLVLLFFGYLLFVVIKQKKLSETQKDFVNNMTHEFKTPLTSILLASEFLKSNTNISSQLKNNHYNLIIHKEATRLQSHVEQILLKFRYL